jgi:hypothetical protein
MKACTFKHQFAFSRAREKALMLALAAASALLLLAVMTVPASAQSTGSISGTVVDSQNSVVPGAAVTLLSETKGTTVGTTVSNEMGLFVFPNVAPDKYTIQVEMALFKTLKRTGLDISPGPVTAVGNLTIEVGGTTETVTVTGEAALIQTMSGEKSYTLETQKFEALPMVGRDWSSLLALQPGVSGTSADGGAGQSTWMVDGLTNMDPGINRSALKMSIDALSEVKAITSSYQAEYGRSSGMQINAVTKSGTNQIHGGAYLVMRNDKWGYSNSKTNILNGNPRTKVEEKDYGFTLGGPIGKPSGKNKLFFFINGEFNPRTSAGSVIYYRMPSLSERQGDFSQTLDNNGNLYPYIKDYQLTGSCSSSNQSACFKDGGVLGKIPVNRLYATGLNILNWYPEPNLPTTTGVTYNYKRSVDKFSMLGWQPLVKIDYQVRNDLRVSWRGSEYLQPTNTNPGNIPGFTDIKTNNIGIYGLMFTANWTVNPSTYIEGSYGRNWHAQVGCSVSGGAPNPCTSQGSLSTSPKSNRKNVGMMDLPYLYPDAFAIDKSYFAYETLMKYKPAYWNSDAGVATIVPQFSWGGRITNSPPGINWPSFMQNNVTNNVILSLTRITGTHTIKTGWMLYHNLEWDGRSSMQGSYNFGNDTANPYDSQFGFANAALGIFSSITQTKRWSEGADNARNIEWYVQDTWKVTRKLTLDYGLRFINSRAVFDQRLQGSNFLPETYKASDAPLLYQYGCANGVYPCSGTNRVAINPVTGAVVGTSAQASVIVGTLVPGTGKELNGLGLPGKTISKTNYIFPKIVLAPRWGVAYDVTGKQKFVLRGGGGLFYDRTQTQESYTVVNNPPTSGTGTVRYGLLSSMSSTGLATTSPSSLRTFDYKPGVPASMQWNAGVQMALPWSLMLDFSYVGNHAWDQWTSSQNPNSIDIGMAFDPTWQDPTQPTVTMANPNYSLVSTNVNQAHFYKEYGSISHITFNQWQTYHSLQISLNRRMKNGIAVGFSDTIGLYDHSKINDRFKHNYVNRTVTNRDDQQQAQDLLGNNNPSKSRMNMTFTYALPRLNGGTPALKALSAVVNGWQLSGIWSYTRATPYTIGYSYTSNGSNLYLTGSPDYSARVIVIGEPGGGCRPSDADRLKQFNTSAFKGPAVGSVGLESGNNYLTGCNSMKLDLAVNRTIRMGESKTLQIRVDMFNAPNQARISGRNTTMNLNSPSDPTTITNLPYDSAGNVIVARSKPTGAGFGVATGYQSPRTMQFTFRFNF